MDEHTANLLLERIINQGIFKDSNTAFVGVFERDQYPGEFEIQQGVHNFHKFPEDQPFVEVISRDQLKIEIILKNEILMRELLDEYPVVKIIDTPRFYGLASKSNASRFAAIGNYFIKDCLGTLGAFFIQNNADDIFFITNWHVLVNENIKLGYPIIQPEDVNQLLLGDEIGKLYSYYLDDYMDVAIGILNKNVSLKNSNIKIDGFDTPKLGRKLIKQGAGTNNYPSEGAKVLSVNCSVRVSHINYPNDERIFHNQIMTQDMAAPEDSGSVSIDKLTGKAIGLIFADNGFKYTIHNPLWMILKDRKPSFKIINGVNRGKVMPQLNFKEFI